MSKLLQQVKSGVSQSLRILDNTWVRIIIAVAIILYIVGGIPFLTEEVSGFFHNSFVKLAFLLLIIYIGLKDIPLALLLALAFVLSLQMGYQYQFGTQIGASQSGITTGANIVAGPANMSLKANLTNPFGSSDGTLENMVGGISGDNDSSIKGGNYNHYSDCVKECADGGLSDSPLSSPCAAVKVWPEELNAQGMNCPLGFSGGKAGAPF